MSDAESLRPHTHAREHLALLALFIVGLCLSGIRPYDRLTWCEEVAPAVAAVIILAAVYGRFRFTPLVYRLVLLHTFILMLGGHYSYARVPLGFWAQELFHFTRNHYDRVGHFAQGFVPAIVTREVLLRLTPLRRGGWLFFLTVSVCLAFSAFYEFTEWWTALVEGERAADFLGTQGDPWDTQWDMFMAFIGAIAAQLVLSRRHDRELERLGALGDRRETETR